MADNAIVYQDTIRLTVAAATYVKGRMHVIGDTLVMVAESKVVPTGGGEIDVWAPGMVLIRRVTRNTGDSAWTVGAKVYWDATNNRYTTTAASHGLAGIAAHAATGSATRADILYVPIVQD